MDQLREFAERYTAAWCSGDPASVAAHYAPDGLEDVVVNDNDAEYHWTLVGTNTGPGGTGNRVRIGGFEEWTIGDDGLIAASLGHYDQAEYDRQLAEGV